MSAAHAPGPWKLGHSGYANTPHIIYTGANGPRFDHKRPLTGCNWIAEVRYDESPDQPTLSANARLIAAAPDLLAALKLARQCIAYCRRAHSDAQSGDGIPVELVIDAAIAKAVQS